MNVIVPQECKEIMSTYEFKTLEIVRNNVHTYFKKGNFALKANQIIDKNLNEINLIKENFYFNISDKDNIDYMVKKVLNLSEILIMRYMFWIRFMS